MSKEKVLITGGTGQLGIDISEVLKGQQYDVYAFSREELDISNNSQVIEKLNKIKPDIVIHSAAYTKVDLAEENQDDAYLINAIGTRNVAVAADKIKAKLVYISTDYVFDGEKQGKYNEFDIPNPKNVYGRTKLAGENIVRDFHSEYFIVRTSWLYGENGSNFVKTMLLLAEKGVQIKVVNDQLGSPTYTIDVADKISELIKTQLYGIYHVTNSGSCTWYEFANKIFEYAQKKVNVEPVSSMEYTQIAKRPQNSVLDHMGLRLNNFPTMRNWENALIEFLLTKR
ncbi:dTDP-4-dehydrorhamnose reductase [Fredinandcohnia quinoae]|uniref:dTDP-4-dehydrorhamnose reductase n=1 Tax=Fredinandcohnia quinoae TaxID=2918902 RepID=A0AAW5E6N1_9BACI|nr:dTDP-4-dehydrorhamnose reductase [Fredinandcohnia sp. SECRCQ15]MCH1625061.1 dTDP-4-dehydrorhamnose reductase [Fredinandcohnia sp. SECRCQ15]